MIKPEELSDQGPSFTISTQLLQFTQFEQALKVSIKNIGLRTTSYEVVISDQQHFKLASLYRSFSLAPGITKNITVKHVDGLHCQSESRHTTKARVRDCNGKWISFQCRCPCFTVHKQPELIEYPKQISLGLFDQKASFEIEFKNISEKNLKIVFEQRTPLKSSPSQANILISSSDKRLVIRNLSHDSICLRNETIRFQMELTMSDHGSLHQKLNFNIVAEEVSNKMLKNKEPPKLGNFQSKLHSIQLSGFCVSKKLLVRDESQKVVTEIRNEVLTGTSKSSFFFIETQYHQDLPYVLEAYFETENPQKYAEKWRNISIQFNSGKKSNFYSGVLKAQALNKIEYRISVDYTVNDQNYVAKYSKIQFEDDSNALRMRNSQYSKKYEDLQVRIVAKVQKEAKRSQTSRKIEDEWESNFFTVIPFKCTLINPSLRCQVSSVDQVTNIIILNETKIAIPYNFPLHSLYRIGKKGTETQSLQSILQPNKKESIMINWTKPNERCSIYMEIPSYDVVLFQTRDSEMKQKNMISLPPSRRRPMTSCSSSIKAKERETEKTLKVSNPTTRPSSVLPSKSTNLLSAFKTCRDPKALNGTGIQAPSVCSKKTSTIMKDLPRNYLKRPQDYIPEVDQLHYLVQLDNFIKNVHQQRVFIIEIIGSGYLILNPHEMHIFQKQTQFYGDKDTLAWGMEGDMSISYKIYGHSPTYVVKMQRQIQNTSPREGKRNDSSIVSHRLTKTRLYQISNLYQPPAYQILTREIKMSFKESKQEFQIVEAILIKNLSSEELEVHCVSIDGEFFKCKEPNGLLTIKPEEIGKFKIAFQPENTVRLSVLNRKPPKQLRRKAIVKSDHAVNISDNSTIVNKEIKLLINKNVEGVVCLGEIIQKSCSIKPYAIKLTNCKYGSPEIIETMIITNTSSHKINFIIENPSEISIKPKSGCIMPKCTQNCTITFKPCKKISNMQENIKIFIGGSHLELVPLLINVEDPQIYIKETELVPSENAICGTQVQELNLEMTLINNNPSQSFIEINLKDTPLSLGFTKNYHSINSGLVMENFIRCSQIVQEAKKASNPPSTAKKFSNSFHTILSQDDLSRAETQNENTQSAETEQKSQVCSITVAANSFLIVPLTLRVLNPKIGCNLIKVQKNIASLVGFGEIKSPHTIRYNCNKTLLHINPYKQFNEIVLIQSQKNYQINLKNTSEGTVRVKTLTKQLGKQRGANEPSIICTYKDIQEDIKPETSINLNMNFICFEDEKKTMKTAYELIVYVRECDGKQNQYEDDPEEGYTVYFTTIIDVIVPEPFLEINPNVLVMPTVGVNTWSRQSFLIRNNGYKEIFVKIIKPINIAFDFDCQIVKPESRGNLSSLSKEKNKAINAISTISIRSEERKSHKNQQKILENQLTKINNTIEVRVNFKSKEPISFRVMVEIEDNLNKKYEIAVVGTCTQSPFFAYDTPLGEFVSAASFQSHRSFNSEQSFSSNYSNGNGHNQGLRKNNLQPTDIEDLLFLNNWIGSLIPEISNESTFFYVWLTKVENFMKFLKQFNVSLNLKGHYEIPKPKVKVEKRTEEKQTSLKLSLVIIFEDLKQQGFQLNSLRIELLQKADQLQWLNFMWFFLSKTILSPNFLTWLSKNTSYREVQEINYTFVQKNFQQLLTILMSTALEIKKESNNNKPIDWKYLIENFEPLLQNFKRVQSRRHLILSLNIIYHKFNNIQHVVIEISDFEFALNVQNPHTRKVRYFLQCNPKLVVCEESSNKVMPTQTARGYSFIVQEGQQISITFSLRNYTLNALSVITKSVLDLLDVVMFNNFIWDPITVFQIKLKRKDDVIHHVNIQCQNKSSQEWVYKFESHISAEYRIFFEPSQNSESIRLLSGQPGFLKKGQSTTIRVVYCPENMNKCEATLRIANTMAKEVFLIHGKPLHSSKIEFEKKLKIIQGQEYQETITIPWQNVAINSSLPNLKTSSQGPNSPKVTTSSTSRQQNGAIAALKQGSNGPVYSLKLFNPLNPSVLPTNKYIENLIKKVFTYNPQKKELAINLTFKYQELVRNLELLFQVTSTESSQSKLVRLIVDVVPKPILIHAEIECEYNRSLIENLVVQNIAKIPESVAIEYGYLPKETDIVRFQSFSGSPNSGLLQNVHKGLFEVLKVKNNDLLSFGSLEKMSDHIDIGLKYFPNENNCYYDQRSVAEESKPTTPNLTPKNITPGLKKRSAVGSNFTGNSNNNSYEEQTEMEIYPQRSNTQLPFFYIMATYQQSLFKLIYIFKPVVRKSVSKIQSILSQQKKDIAHQCLPLVKYQNNFIYIQNQLDETITYDVETDLYEITGKNEITVKPLSVGKYCYEIFCLHLGRKEGKITFKQSGNRNSNTEFNVSIAISETAQPPNPSNSFDSVNASGCVPKGSCLEEGLRIYNEYFEITSTIRKPKVFSIFLANLSMKQIEYEVRCNEEYLRPHIPGSNAKRNTIKIGRQSEYELEIMYLPYFTGKKEAKLHLYNPHQPQITYRISMIAEQAIERINREMNRIGENKPIEIAIENPFPKGKANSTSQKEEPEVLQLQLVSLVLNQVPIDQKQFYNHLKIIEEVNSQGSQSPESPQSWKVKVKFFPAGNHVKNSNKFYLMFLNGQLAQEYKYDLVFNTQSYGQYKYKVCFKYPQVEKMEPIIIYSNGNCTGFGSSSKIKLMTNQKDNQIKLNLPFVNRFNEDLQLMAKCMDESQEISAKFIQSQEPSQNESLESKNNFENRITIGAYRKHEVKLVLDNRNKKSKIQVELRTLKEPVFRWVYPITIYKVYEYQEQGSKRAPIVICGEARIPITARIYPLISFNCDNVRLVEQNVDGQNSKIEVRMKDDLIRKRVVKGSYLNPSKIREEVPSGTREKPQSNMLSYPDNLVSVDRSMPDHTYLNSQYVYELELEINAACAMKTEGHFYIYQSSSHIESKHISPASSQKHIVKQDQFISEKRKDCAEYFVEKIPFILKIDPPKTEVLQFQANVGQKSTIKIKIDSPVSTPKEKQENPSKNSASNLSKVLEYILGDAKKEVKIELHNNKCRQFSAQYNEKQQCIDVTYSAQEYSGLKRGKLEINVGGIYSQYELIGKFPR